MSDHAGRVGRGWRASPRRRVAFTYHVLAEYVLAAALIAGGLRAPGASLLLLASTGIALVLLAACTRSRLGAFRALSPRAHHVLDLVLLALLALSPLLFHSQLHLLGVVLAELVALVLLRVERGTTYSVAPGGARRPAEPVASFGSAASRASSIASAAGRQLAPAAGRVARAGFRGLGLAAGAARRAARERGGQGSRAAG